MAFITPVAIAACGAVLAVAAWALYLSTIPRNVVPERPVGFVLLQLLAAALGGIGIVMSYANEGLSAAVVVPGVVAIQFGVLFLFVLSQRRTPIGEITVRTGDNLLPFTATTAEGGSFDSASLNGKRTLIKFFRGHW